MRTETSAIGLTGIVGSVTFTDPSLGSYQVQVVLQVAQQLLIFLMLEYLDGLKE